MCPALTSRAAPLKGQAPALEYPQDLEGQSHLHSKKTSVMQFQSHTSACMHALMDSTCYPKNMLQSLPAAVRETLCIHTADVW